MLSVKPVFYNCLGSSEAQKNVNVAEEGLNKRNKNRSESWPKHQD